MYRRSDRRTESIIAMLTRCNQGLHCTAGLNACWDTATPLTNGCNNGGMIKLVEVRYQTEPNLTFFPKVISSTTTSVSVRNFLTIDLQCNVFTARCTSDDREGWRAQRSSATVLESLSVKSSSSSERVHACTRTRSDDDDDFTDRLSRKVTGLGL